MNLEDVWQIKGEMDANASVMIELLALATTGIYQHVAVAAGLNDAWVFGALGSHVEMIRRESAKLRKPQFAAAFADGLERLSRHFQGLALIEGGAGDGPESG